MSEIVIAKIVDASPDGLQIFAPYGNWERFIMRKYEDVEVILRDGRQLSPSQRAAIILTTYDIADFISGYAHKSREFEKTLATLQFLYVYDLTTFIGDPEYREMIRHRLTMQYCKITESPMFSLSPKSESCIDMTTASDFLGWLIDLCIEHAIPCSGSLLNRAEDIGRYLYSCIAHKRCAICGEKADLHHVDTVGAGRNRREITHLGMRAESLCRSHHSEAHTIGQMTFDEKYHLHGIEMDDRLCEIHRLKH